MEPYLSFDVWTCGFKRGRELLESSSFFEKVKEEMRWRFFIAWPAKSWSLRFKGITCVNMYDALTLHVLNFNWLHV